ncbi:acid protease [Myriangium duriaei CBS 260.36]|uniref:Acid protease n=1 Tax=Myriangium duriaei CBS 260.36 TaxID=1168546 RepID=A0A9P4IWN6_9PEZI|nr:acid protease [Myriangium duriaei CBS 260.36]
MGMSQAKPVHVGNGSTFRVNQVAIPKTNGSLSPAQHILQAHTKYGQLNLVPDAIKQAAAHSGGVIAYPDDHDKQYLCPVSVGGQILYLNFDTGSTDLWVFSTLTPGANTKEYEVYDPRHSGHRANGESWRIRYQDGSGSSGIVFLDTVTIGGVTATNQAVEVATYVSKQFIQDEQIYGLLGLAPRIGGNTCYPRKCIPYFDNISGSLAQQLFTVRLRKGKPGTYDFGYIDRSLYRGSISWVEQDPAWRTSWTFYAGEYSVDGNYYEDAGLSVADTGTTLLLVSNRILEDYYENIPSATVQDGMVVFDCRDHVPDFHLNIGKGVFVVPGSFIAWRRQGNTCVGGIQSNHAALPGLALRPPPVLDNDLLKALPPKANWSTDARVLEVPCHECRVGPSKPLAELPIDYVPRPGETFPKSVLRFNASVVEHDHEDSLILSSGLFYPRPGNCTTLWIDQFVESPCNGSWEYKASPESAFTLQWEHINDDLLGRGIMFNILHLSFGRIASKLVSPEPKIEVGVLIWPNGQILITTDPGLAPTKAAPRDPGCPRRPGHHHHHHHSCHSWFCRIKTFVKDLLRHALGHVLAGLIVATVAFHVWRRAFLRRQEARMNRTFPAAAVASRDAYLEKM